MRRRTSMMLAALAAHALAFPADLPAGGDAAAEIVVHERAFAASVRSLGVRDGFLAWLSSTGIVFRPGPVIGRTVYEKQARGWNGLLAWTPVRAAISADGRMGWSTGPWTFRADSNAAEAQGHGEYLSVWKRAADGSWKVALDGGISHPAPAVVETTVTYSGPVPGERLGSQPLAARKSLYEADAGFVRTSSVEGVSFALGKYGADDVIVLREGTQRLVGRGHAQGVIATREGKVQMISTAQYIAESGDLGYTYGSFVSGTAAAPDSAWYVHVWHRGASASWRLACQMVMPLPKPKK